MRHATVDMIRSGIDPDLALRILELAQRRGPVADLLRLWHKDVQDRALTLRCLEACLRDERIDHAPPKGVVYYRLVYYLVDPYTDWKIPMAALLHTHGDAVRVVETDDVCCKVCMKDTGSVLWRMCVRSLETHAPTMRSLFHLLDLSSQMVYGPIEIMRASDARSTDSASMTAYIQHVLRH